VADLLTTSHQTETHRSDAIVRRLCPAGPSDRISGWLGPLAVAVFAGGLRFWRLGTPRALIFDETYYAKDAWSLLRFGVEHNAVKDADKLILDGRTDVLGPGGSYVVHPSLGKWIIGVGEHLFGLTPFGWRFAVAVLGTVGVLLTARIGRRLFGSTLLGCVAGLLLAVDGLHFTLSRTALLDGILGFWILAAFGCLVLDRERTRLRLAGWVASDRIASPFGPGFGVRPWRLAAGVCLGLACATKWNGLYFLAAFGVLTVAWDVGARRLAGARRPFRATLLRDSGPAVLSLVGVTVVIYVTSWAGWLASSEGYLRDWATVNHANAPWGFVPDALRSLWHYHAEAYRFHRSLDDFHPYRSNPWGWLVLSRPVMFFAVAAVNGDPGCTAAECEQSVTSLGNPLLWGALLPALVVLAWRSLGWRDWRASALLTAIAAGYLPWFLFQHRTIYQFYAGAFVPFVALAVTFCLGLIIGRAEASPTRRTIGAVAVGVYVTLAVIAFFYFYPVLAGEVIPRSDWYARMWSSSWI
jgi:dolichyl-phosphate-mannose-protein mannosyltransferase